MLGLVSIKTISISGTKDTTFRNEFQNVTRNQQEMKLRLPDMQQLAKVIFLVED